jgi:hypothetical protein
VLWRTQRMMRPEAYLREHESVHGAMRAVSPGVVGQT